MVDSPFAWPEVTSAAVIAVPVLLVALLVVAVGSRKRLLAAQREQRDELTRLRQDLARLSPGPSRVPRIGAEDPVFQIGERVAIVDGPHSGDQGTVVDTPEWVRQGFVCVELVRERGRRFMPVAKLSRLDEPVG
ncbi:hypothetical protein [Actinophytocola xinjiangensis]|uniref:hypothetical protein n=1 Tax=Actinophytocola xinjiangensis TaxID=485602 RepID=UPI000B0CB133|nr:hypothetical protein [Actinophytocola xinjiangensis]